MNEKQMQAILMNWVMGEKNHQWAAPNLTPLYHWEADLVSSTKAGLLHEYEIKVSRADFLADAKKIEKHSDLVHRYLNGSKPRTQPRNDYERMLIKAGLSIPTARTPNYFWYAVNGFEVEAREVVDYAGLLRVIWRERCGRHVVEVVRTAPRLHRGKVEGGDILRVNRWLAYKLKNMYSHHYNGAPDDAS